MCTALDEIICYFINYVCSNYSDLKSQLKQHIEDFIEQSKRFSFPNIQSRTSRCIFLSVFCILENLYRLPVSLNEMSAFIVDLFKENEAKTGDDPDAVINDFINVLNDVICENEVNIKV